ncbi:MAG TPA: aminoglycoside phosphotransferase family protein [Micromonosporaceae bacterium]|nr:aminoglycoside phosphotransferase family protein [Micromonosporaceae bacterium]
MVRVPETVRAKAITAGEAAWLDGLPALVSELADRWNITVGQSFDDATEALVAEAMLANGMPAVLKIVVPRAGNHARNEITMLRLDAGRGCVRLLAHDEARGAMLLERLGRSMYELDLPIRERHEILCSLAQRVWRPAPEAGLPTGADKGRWLQAFITSTWEELGRPCSELAVRHALDCADRRIAAHDDARAVLVHGDVHQWNALESPTGFKLVDPDGLLAEPEYDLGVMMREDPVELMDGDPYERAVWLAERTGLDAMAIWEWGVVERVATGLVCTRIGLQPVGRDMLAVADRIAKDFAGRP